MCGVGTMQSGSRQIRDPIKVIVLSLLCCENQEGMVTPTVLAPEFLPLAPKPYTHFSFPVSPVWEQKQEAHPTATAALPAF